MAIERNAHATWEGDLRSGNGRFEVGSGAISGQEVTFASRFEEPGGKTSPEELIAAAHATCFSMALANGLAQAGHAPTRLETDAVCTLDQTDAGFRITSMHLTVRGEVEGVDEAAFQEAAQQAKEGCPVSNALGGVEISMEASLG
ncbi:MAG TPA: OsmC family peroxiredoxin [Gaiellaceae bacterium]|jgi:osmotically inducible protein OsmC